MEKRSDFPAAAILPAEQRVDVARLLFAAASSSSNSPYTR